MAYDTKLAMRIRKRLQQIPTLHVEEKKMFRGLSFLVNGTMCINVSGDDLMCRFDPLLHNEVAARHGYRPMIMRGREYKGYAYVGPDGFEKNSDFEYWINLCLAYNEKAKSSKKKK